ncbi:hypothetical protein NMY22_g17535 [Coprinellus aureogranulatus]|nr:hypothetical protein NMY22_g17535 [Coprinellus aureogranulatus]
MATVVCVDDTDPSIKWDGPWFSTQDNTDDWGNNGPPFLSTLKGISTDGSLTFSYRGTWVSVLGSLRPHGSGGGSRPDPDWECFVDGIRRTPPWAYPDQPSSNFMLCSALWDEVEDRNHTIKLKAVVGREILWVDQVQYYATDTASPDVINAWTKAIYIDSRFKYSGAWTRDPSGYGMATNETATRLLLTYNVDTTGQGIVFGGYTLTNPAASDGLGSYSIDGQLPTEFVIPAPSAFQQPYFSILTMEPGQHRLEVVNKGNSSTAALGFHHIYTKNSPVIATQSGPSKRPRIVGAAVGGVFGAIVIAALAIWGIVLLRRLASTTASSENDAGQSPKASHPQRSQASSTHLPTSDDPPRANHEVGTSTNPTLPGPVLREGEPPSSLFPGEQSPPPAATQGTSLEPGGLPSSALHYLQTMDGKADTDDPPQYARDAK